MDRWSDCNPHCTTGTSRDSQLYIIFWDTFGELPDQLNIFIDGNKDGIPGHLHSSLESQMHGWQIHILKDRIQSTTGPSKDVKEARNPLSKHSQLQEIRNLL